MADERKQVLEMLAAGKISAEQADRLLEALQPRVVESAPEHVMVGHAGHAGHPPRFRRERKESNLNPQVRRLMEARMHGVTADFVREMEAVGFKGLDLAELTQMRIHGINAQFAREMQQMMGDLSP